MVNRRRKGIMVIKNGFLQVLLHDLRHCGLIDITGNYLVSFTVLLRCGGSDKTLTV